MTDKKFIICHATLYCFSVVVCICVWVYLGVNTCAIASSRPTVSALHVLLVQQKNNCQLCVEKINYIILICFQIAQRFLDGVEVKFLNMPGKWKLPTRQTAAGTSHLYIYTSIVSRLASLVICLHDLFAAIALAIEVRFVCLGNYNYCRHYVCSIC